MFGLLLALKQKFLPRRPDDSLAGDLNAALDAWQVEHAALLTGMVADACEPFMWPDGYVCPGGILVTANDVELPIPAEGPGWVLETWSEIAQLPEVAA